jgi:N-acetylglucosamine malate deacetylase 2
MPGHLLVVMPHPDDETLSSGGTIALHTRAGGKATYLCGTLGQLGRNMGKPSFANRETLPVLREQELREACAILGLDLRLMGLRDKTLEFMDPEWLADRVGEVIAELQPETIVTYHPVHGVHPDHNALGAAVVRAVRRLPKEQRPAVHTRAFGSRLSELGEADLVNNVTPVMDIKLAAIRAHRSQTQAMFADMEARAEKDPEVKARMLEMRSIERFWFYRFDD